MDARRIAAARAETAANAAHALDLALRRYVSEVAARAAASLGSDDKRAKGAVGAALARARKRTYEVAVREGAFTVKDAVCAFAETAREDLRSTLPAAAFEAVAACLEDGVDREMCYLYASAP